MPSLRLSLPDEECDEVGLLPVAAEEDAAICRGTDAEIDPVGSCDRSSRCPDEEPFASRLNVDGGGFGGNELGFADIAIGLA